MSLHKSRFQTSLVCLFSSDDNGDLLDVNLGSCLDVQQFNFQASVKWQKRQQTNYVE